MQNVFTALITIMVLLVFIGSQYLIHVRKQGKHHH